jgi:DNA-binding beta-propeller fold protein YncE
MNAGRSTDGRPAFDCRNANYLQQSAGFPLQAAAMTRKLSRMSLLSAAVLAAALSVACKQVPTRPEQPDVTTSARTPQVVVQSPAPALYELAYSARQNALFVTSAGGFGPDAPSPKLLRLDPKTLAVQKEIPLPFKGFGMALDDAAGRLYIGNTVDASITAVDVATNTVIGTLPLLKEKIVNKDGRTVFAHHLRQLALDPANHRLYAPGLSVDVESVLFVIDTRDFVLEKTVGNLGGAATGITLDTVRNRIFVSNLAGQLYTIDGKSLTVTASRDSGADQPLNLAYDRATNRVLLVDQGQESIRDYQRRMIPGFKSRNPGNRVMALDADTGRLLASVPTGDGPIALELDDARQRLYVTNRVAGSVTVFDSRSFALLDTLSLPTHPNSLELDAPDNVLFVSVKNDPKGPAKTANETVVRIKF